MNIGKLYRFFTLSLVLTVFLFNFSYAKSVLKIICDLDNGKIYIDGKFKSECFTDEPVDIIVSAGKHTVEVKRGNKDGSYYYFKRKVNIGDGTRLTITVDTQKILTDDYYYKKAISSKDVSDFWEYLEKYPNGKYAKKVKNILDEHYWKKCTSIEGCKEYLNKIPWGKHKTQAKAKIEKFYADCNSISECKTYLEKYPKGKYAKKVKDKLEKLYFNECEYIGGCETYLKLYPKGRYAKEAKKRLAIYKQNQEERDFDEMCTTVKGCMRFLSKYPSGRLKKKAFENMDKIAFEKCTDIKGCEYYLNTIKHGKYEAQVKEKLEKLYYGQCKNSQDIKLCETYLQKYPNGKYSQNVKKYIDFLNVFFTAKQHKTNCLKGDLLECVEFYKDVKSFDLNKYAKYADTYFKSLIGTTRTDEISKKMEEGLFVSDVINSSIMPTWKEVKMIKKIGKLFFSPNGKYIAIINIYKSWTGGITESEVEIYDTSNWKLIKSFKAKNGPIVFSPNGKYLAVVDNYEAKIYDTSNWKRIEISSVSSGITSVVFSPNGKYLLFFKEFMDDIVNIEDISSGDFITSLKFRYSIKSIKFSPDNNYIFINTYDDSIFIYDTYNWNFYKKIKEPDSINFSPDNKYLITVYGNETVIYDTSNLNEVKRLKANIKPVLSSSGKYLAVIYKNRVKIYDTSNWKLIKSFKAKNGPIVFSPNGKYLAVVDNYEAKIYDTSNWNIIRSLGKYAYWIEFGPYGNYFIAKFTDRLGLTHKVKIYNTLTWEEIESFFSMQKIGIKFSPDGKYIALGGIDNSFIYDLYTKKIAKDFKIENVLPFYAPDGKYAIIFFHKLGVIYLINNPFYIFINKNLLYKLNNKTFTYIGILKTKNKAYYIIEAKNFTINNIKIPANLEVSIQVGDKTFTQNLKNKPITLKPNEYKVFLVELPISYTKQIEEEVK